MGTFKSFEEIHSWQKGREITKRIYTLTDGEIIKRDFGLRDQMRRAAVSIMANIAEGHGRRSRAEFANFLSIARGSAIELQSHLYVALDVGYLERDDFEEVYSMLDEVSRMTVGLALYLRKE